MNIKIAVACHKPSKLPNNSLFLPIQVGAALAKAKLPIQPDDEGNNISEKNPQYCELTAQYWLWKNVKADYYGLCHYRRFLCFHVPKDAKFNIRKQIDASVLDDFNIEHFHLNDSAEMRKEIESCDAVVGELQKIGKVSTPRGNKRTAIKHWVAHDRALIRKEDLDLMLNILDEVSPEIGADARKCLKTQFFLGFNCFVMKAPLFDEMCKIEFAVLERLEQQVDLSTYGQQLSRIYGFMAEIISNAYFYHLEKSEKYKIKHVPLLYFNYTNDIKIPRLVNATSKKPTIPILFDFSDTQAYFFGPTWQSFLDHIDKSCQYDVLLLSNASPELKRSLTEMSAKNTNISLRFLDAKMYFDIIHERYYPTFRNLRQIQNPLNPNNRLLSIFPFLPFFLKEYDKMLVFGRNVLFNESISPIWEQCQKSKKIILSPYNVLNQGCINDIFADKLESRLSPVMKNPLDYFLAEVVAWDFAKYRKDIDCRQIAKISMDNQNGIRPKSDTINILCQNDKDFLPQKWGVWYDSNDYLAYQLPFAPLKHLTEMHAARKNPGIVIYMEDDPWLLDYTEIYSMFWSIARRIPMYEILLQHYSELTHRQIEAKKPIVDKLAPIGSSSRNILLKLAPQGSRRHDIARKILNAMGMK